MSFPGPASCSKAFSFAQFGFLFASVLLLVPVLNSQVIGGKQAVAVPEVTEPWTKTVVPVDRVAHAASLMEADDDQEARASALARTQPAAIATGKSTRGQLGKVARQQQSSTSSIVGTVFNVPFGANPPDPMIAAGPNHLVVVVNTVIAIYTKSGTLVSQTNFSNFFGRFNIPSCCFDPRIVYDQAHQIFVFVAAEKGPQAGDAHIFVAVSQTSDPTGNWNKFVLDHSENGTWPDFPGLGLSDSAVYIGDDQLPFTTGTAEAWITIIPTSELIAGSSTLNVTRFKKVKTGSGASAFGIEPAVTYGTTSQEFLVANPDGNSIPLFAINTAGTPTLSVVNVPVPAFQGPPQATQPGTTTTIPPGANVLSPVWRNNSLWFTQGVADSSGQNPVVRWYELDTPSKSLKQVGTEAGVGEAYYGALTVRSDGGVDLVYCTSSAIQFASAGYAHRDVTDPPNTMSIHGVYKAGDATFTAGRYGDLFGMSADPSGSGTWGIAEIASGGGANHGTAVVNLLSTPASAPPDFSLMAPQSITVSAGSASEAQISVVAANGFSDAVTFAMSGLPAGASASFTPATVNGGGSTKLTVSTTSAVAPGNYPLTVTGSSTGQDGNLSHSAALTLVVAQPAPDFTITPQSQTLGVQAGASATLEIAIAAINGFAGSVTFNVSGLPTGATTNFNPASVPGSGSTTLTVAADSSTPVGQFPLTITASGNGPDGAIAHTAAVVLTVATVAGTPDFSIAAAPPTMTVRAGQTASYSVIASALNGFSGAVTLACAGLPPAASCTFNPNPLTVTSAGAPATLQIATAGLAAVLRDAVPGPGSFASLATMGFSLFGICFIGGSTRRRTGRRLTRPSAKRGQRSTGLLAMLLTLALLGFGCGTVSNHNQQSGSGGSPAPTTPAGTYSVTITANSGSLQHSTSVQLVVQ